MSILIATPYYNAINPKMEACARMVEGHYAESMWVKAFGPIIEDNRHFCVTKTADIRQKIAGNFSHVLFWDCDIYHKNILLIVDRMLELRSPIVSALYDNRDGVPTCGYWKGGAIGDVERFVDKNDNGVVFPDWVPGGFLLCETSALEKMDYPWFRRPIVQPTPTTAIAVGEDVGFSLNAKDCGLPLCVDCSCKMTHEPTVEANSRKADNRSAALQQMTLAYDSLARMAQEAARIKAFVEAAAEELAQGLAYNG
jgi:hypothetical protein